MKIPMKPSGIEPATFQFVAQCLNKLLHQQRASRDKNIHVKIKIKLLQNKQNLSSYTN
jgi:hypothetical protein